MHLTFLLFTLLLFIKLLSATSRDFWQSFQRPVAVINFELENKRVEWSTRIFVVDRFAGDGLGATRRPI